jgi:hypothetical protein
MASSLIQLIATGIENQQVPLNVVYDYRADDIENAQRPFYQVLREADEVIITHIIFKDANLTLDQFKNAIRNSHMQMLIGGIQIFRYDFKLLIELNQVRKIRDSFVVTLPEFLSTKLIMITLLYFDVTLQFNLQHQFTAIQIGRKIIYHENPARRQLAQNNHEQPVQQLYYMNNMIADTHEKTILLDAYHLVKGLFILGNRDNIEHLILSFNGQDRINYDYVMLSIHTYQISENMFYLSFDGTKNYDHINRESYIAAPNFSRLDRVSLTLKFFDITDQRYDIYTLSMNILKYASGMAGLMYTGGESTHTRWESEDRQLDNVIICPISAERIGAEYCMCLTCRNIFSYASMVTWLAINRTCPLCRSDWTNNVKYTRTIVANLDD